MKIVVDSYAWIELFIASKKGEEVKRLIAEADEAITPDIVLSEVARKYIREGVGKEAILERLAAISNTTEVIPIDANVALESGKCYQELKQSSSRRRIGDPSLFDAIVLAMARLRESKVLTGDRHFQGFTEIIWLG